MSYLEEFVEILGLSENEVANYGIENLVGENFVVEHFIHKEESIDDKYYQFYDAGISIAFENDMAGVFFFLVGDDKFTPCKFELISGLTADSTRADVVALLGEPKAKSKDRDDVAFVKYAYEKCGFKFDWTTEGVSLLGEPKTQKIQNNNKNDMLWVKYAYRKCGLDFDQKRTDVVALLSELKDEVKAKDEVLWVKYAYDKFGKHFGVHFTFDNYTEKLKMITLDLDQI